ncbi:MAG: hypothetical protein RR235_09590, partial [Oscillospiraceae bacterium]
ILALLAMVLCFSLTACGEKVSVTPSPAPSPAPSEKAEVVDDASVKTLLTNLYTIDGLETDVAINDGEALVILTSNTISKAFMDASAGDEKAIEQWDKLVASFLDMHNNTRDLMSKLSDSSLTTIMVSEKNLPYISIKDGEVTVDFLHLDK